MFTDKLVIAGPFVGSIDEEVCSFLPFVNWLNENLDIPNLLVSTHYNRGFLYNKPNIPIFKQYTKDEVNQVKHKHNKISSKDFVFLTNEIKEQASIITSKKKSDVIMYNLGYGNIPNISNYQKLFKSICPYLPKNKILFLPEKSFHKSFNYKLFQMLKDIPNIDVIGLKEQNSHNFIDICNHPFYYTLIYRLIISKIFQSNLVITPCSHWTILCNYHQIPVLSWGENINIYKKTFNFGNKKSYIINTNNKEVIYKSIISYIETMEKDND